MENLNIELADTLNINNHNQMARYSHKIFTPTNDDGSCYEKTADCCLAYPKIMYDQTDSNFNDEMCTCMKNTPAGYMGTGGIVYFCVIPFQIISNLLAIPLFLIGAPMKECALCCDDDAHQRNMEVFDKLQTDKENKIKQEHNERINNKIARVNRDIKEYEDLKKLQEKRKEALNKVKIIGEDDGINEAKPLLSKQVKCYSKDISVYERRILELNDEKDELVKQLL